MRTKFFIGLVNFSAVAAFSSGCGSKTVTSTASVYNGPTAGTSQTTGLQARSLPQALVSYGTPQDGSWYLSPDKMVITVTSIKLGDGDAANVSCPITYDASKPGLTKLADCPFSVKEGNYSNGEITISPSYQVFINDPTNGFYTTASGIVTTPPDTNAANNGAQFYTFNSTNTMNTQKFTTFSSNMEVKKGSPGALNVVISGLQFFRVEVSGGVVTIHNNGNSDPGNLPDMIFSPSSLSRVAYYSNSGIGKAGSFVAGGVQGMSSATVFYTDATTPYWVQLGLNGSQNGCPVSGAAGAMNNAANGYLGLDSSGHLGWALGSWSSSTGGFTSYSTEFMMPQVTTLGATTPLYCVGISSDPAPARGSFSSGAPAISSPSNQVATMVLVAQ